MTNKTAALRYARALLDVALQEKADLDRIERELNGFAALFSSYPQLAKVLLNPAVPVPRKRAAVAELTATVGLMPTVAKLVALLAERDRLVLLPDLVAAYRDRLMTHRNVVRAEVVTAVPLPADRQKAVERSLAGLTGRTVSMTARVDASIVGGVIAKVGSTVYDASVTRQLERLRERLAESRN